ncbi:MAG: transporter substrate-binding protein [Polyangiaceae bacterium]|jgi:glucose/mannose transport system substrate-binding protein|nr:transporter substrate-binding protein [Polyangiaceae bacterium]
MRKLTRRGLFGLGLPLYLSGCSDDEKDAPNVDEEKGEDVEIFSWWIAPGEADAFDALVNLHKESHPHQRVYNAAIESGDRAREALAERLDAGEPPDIFQENVYNLKTLMARNPNSLTALDDLFDELGLVDVIVPEVLEDVRIDGKIYSMPVNIHRENAVHYNKQIFDDLGLAIPTTLEEFLAACETILAAGITPLATSYEGWVQRVLFQALHAGMIGAQPFADYLNGKSAVEEAGMAEAIDLLGEVLGKYVNDSAGDEGFGWTSAAQLVLDGKAAMFIHGDWAKGYLVQLGWTPGEGFGVFAMPGATDLFFYGVDVFALVNGSPHESAARDFLRTVASKDGQVVFNEIKGSSSIRLDVDESRLDVVAQGTLADLRNAKVRLLVRRRDEWDPALALFAKGRDKDALLKVFSDFPPPS